MAGGVSLGPGRDWMVAGWVFESLIEKACAGLAADSELRHWLQVGLANNLVAPYLRDPVTARELTGLLAATALAELDTPALTDRDQAYRDALRELVTLLRTADF